LSEVVADGVETVHARDDVIERLTYYSRTLESLVVAA
jgi:hypothetical protein